ncbi:MAG: alpha/beta fold hydrolase [bacterium]|nr:alpha/beta fold hydrolase [bacterium]
MTHYGTILALLTDVAMSTCALPPGDHTLTLLSSHDRTSQPYRLFVPTAAENDHPLPLLVVLHGHGVDHNAWFDLTPIKDAAEQHGYLIVAPNGRGPRYYNGPGEQDVLDIIAHTRRTFPVDPDRVYLTGHSMGGWGTWYIGLRHPDLFASICPLAGIPIPELLPNARHLAPLIIHDTGDDVVSVEQSRQPARRLAELGISHQYREEHGFGHSSKMIGASLPRMFEWFDRHHRVNQPRRVTFVVQPGEHGQAYWIHIPPTADWVPAPFAVDAQVDARNRLSIRTEHLLHLIVALNDLPLPQAKTLEVQIDGQSIAIARRTPWAVFTRAPSDKKWTCELHDTLTDAPNSTNTPVAPNSPD